MSERKITKAVFFTTDYGFLIPTMVAAIQVSQQLTIDSGIDILIFLIDFLEVELAELNWEYHKHGIRFIDMKSSQYNNSQSYYYESHVPKSTLARLCVGQQISTQYESLIYIDGDVQIVGDISPLLRWKVRDGCVLAGLDQGLLQYGEPGSSVSKWYEAYTRELGLKTPMEYFNAGVMALQRTTLVDIGPAALGYFLENGEKCLQHDQSALNAVLVGRREYLSPRYNFMPKFQEIGGTDIVDPTIIHFADRHKPWHDPVVPWMAQYAAVYDEIVAKHPILQKYVRYMSKRPKNTAYRPGIFKSAVLLLAFPARRLARRRKLRNYMAQTSFAFP
jgi:lipopolysaccharide biosynthesis glycosyltransferase